MVTAINATDEKIRIEPNPDEWREIIRIHIHDLVPIMALALERTLVKSQENEATQRFVTMIFNIFKLDFMIIFKVLKSFMITMAKVIRVHCHVSKRSSHFSQTIIIQIN